MNYQLTQTGEQVQDILNQAPTTEETLQAEITRSTNKDDALELAIGNEKTRAEGVESNLQTAIGNEITRAEGAEVNLQTAIGNEKTRAELVEGALRTDVDGINAKIPASASSENKLATESFVNSSISTNTADFKGTYTSLEQLQTEVHDANANDYAFVISTDATGNTAYNRYKYVEGTGWVFEYALNNSSFTSAQWAAINSAITAALVAKLTGLPTATELTTQLNAIIDSVATEKSRAEGIESGLRTDVNANATAIGTEKTRAEGVEGTLSTAIGNEKTRAEGAELVLQQNINAEALLRGNADTTLQTAIDGINAKIPAAASASNQLADKTFVNSSIATNTATFRGTYNSVAALDEVTADNNDYAFVVATDTAGNTIYNRYKYVEGSGWVFEYALNNSSFTATQWAAVNSGITAALVTKLDGLPDNTALTAMFTAITSLIPAAATSDNKLVDYAQLVAGLATKQNTLTFDNVPTENSSNPVKSGGVYMAIATVTAAVVGLQSSKQDVLTFDQYPTAGSNNPVKSTGIYTAIENAVAPKADKTDLDNAVIRISTNEVDIAQLQAAYRGLTQNDVVPVAPTDTWPVANPQENVIYRVADRTNTPPQYYTDYMWNGTVMVEMAQYDNAIDSRPKKDSQNLVTSGGVFENMGALDVSELNATENPHTLATYVDLSAALAAIPSDYQKGGMSIKFVQSSDNKYVQYRLMKNQWSATPSDWQGVDAVPTPGSHNLVESGGVYNAIIPPAGNLFRPLGFCSDGSAYYSYDNKGCLSINAIDARAERNIKYSIHLIAGVKYVISVDWSSEPYVNYYLFNIEHSYTLFNQFIAPQKLYEVFTPQYTGDYVLKVARRDYSVTQKVANLYIGEYDNWMKLAIANGISPVFGEGVTDAQAINRAIVKASKSPVKVCKVPAGTYSIDESIVVYSGTQLLSSPNAVYNLADNSNCAMLINDSRHITSKLNSNIIIDGGTWNGNRANQEKRGSDFSLVVGFWLCGISNLSIINLTVNNTRTYGMLINNVDNVKVDNVTISVGDVNNRDNCDGLHIIGPATNVKITNSYIKSEDNALALNSQDNDHGPYTSAGAIDRVIVDNVTIDNGDGGQGVLILAAHYKVSNILFRNMSGAAKYFCQMNHWFLGAEGEYGTYENIYFENIEFLQYRGGGEGAIYMEDGTFKNIVLRNFHLIDSVRYYVPNAYAVVLTRSNDAPATVVPSISNLVFDNFKVDRNNSREETWTVLGLFNSRAYTVICNDLNSIYMGDVCQPIIAKNSIIAKIRIGNSEIASMASAQNWIFADGDSEVIKSYIDDYSSGS